MNTIEVAGCLKTRRLSRKKRAVSYGPVSFSHGQLGTKSKIAAVPCNLHTLFHSGMCSTMTQVYLVSLKFLHRVISEI